MMRWTGEASMLAGAIAATLVGWLVYTTTNRPVDTQVRGVSLLPGVARVVLALVAAHVALLGVSVWLDVGAWPGRLPPITLLSFLLALGFCVLPRATAMKG
jgi:peptidoglycan biosynthesis protein MviN/MurJ (putative lipid II flippase)